MIRSSILVLQDAEELQVSHRGDWNSDFRMLAQYFSGMASA
jgi:hypothetical protein